MADSPHVFDATADNFPRLVLENSGKGPVVVNYWSPRAGPCLMLMPRLVRLAAEFGGRFLLVMLNTDEFGRLAREHGVACLSTIKVFRNGRLEARYQLSAVRLVANDYDAAMQQLLEIATRGSGARRDRGRGGLLALFELLGEDDERVPRYRALLPDTMH